MSYDYSKLLGRIVEKYGSQKAFAGALGMSEHSLSVKLGGKSFKQKDIDRSCELLDIAPADIGTYFFTRKVHS